MANIKDFIKKIGNEAVSLEEQQQALVQVEQTIIEAKAKREESIGKNVDLVISALKTIESKLEAKLDELNNTPAKQGVQGPVGKAGQDGLNGKDGRDGLNGKDGIDGKDGVDGQDGVSVVDAKIDFDGSLVVYLSNGNEIDCGQILSPDVAQNIIINSGGSGTSQAVTDTIASLQEQINGLSGASIPSQTGHAGEFLTTDGTTTSWAAVSGGGGGVTSFNTRTGAVTLSSSDVTTALTYTPYNATNPAGYTSNTGTVTGVTATSPVASTGGTAPVISMEKATTSVDGYLSATDWTTFNSKQPAGTYATGTGSASGTNTGDETTATVKTKLGVASTSADGYLSSTDWNTFNGKQAALVSGTNIKTVNGTTLLGSGDLTIAASAGGSNTQVQYNSTGSLAGSANFTWDGTTLKASNVESTNGGVYATSTFTGTFTDGIVIDHVAGNARISAGSSDDITFYNGGVAGSELGHASSNGDWVFNGNVQVGLGTLIGGATNPLIQAAGSANSYVQTYVHNDLAGSSASADLSVYPNNGTDATGWLDFGITSSAYSDVNFLTTGANEGYIFMSAPSGSGTSGNLVYATDSTGSTNAHQWYVGGFNQAKSAWKMQLTSSGLQLANALPITSGGTGSTTAGGALTSLGAQASLVSGTNIKTINSTSLLGSGDVAVQPTLVSATNIKTINGSSILGSGDLTVTGSFTGGTLTSQLKVAVGTATAGTAPLEFQAGTLNTTAEAGAVEYDGNTPYFSIAASTRGVLPTEQIVVLTGNNTLTSQTAVQPIFDGGGGPTNGSVTLPIGTYQYECSFAATGLSATSGSFGFALGGAATKTYTYQAQASKAGTALTTPMATNSTFGSAAITTLVANSTGTVANLLVKGIIRVTVAGTVIPQVSLTVASAAIIQAGSYFKVSPLGNATVATVGNWI